MLGSPARTPSGLPVSHAAARDAIRIALATGRAVVRHDDLVLERLLLANPPDELERLVESQVGKLMRYDESSGSDLCRTLEVYLGVLGPAVGDVLDADAISMVATAGGTGYDKAPAAAFTSSPAAPAAGQTVTFTDTSTDPDGTVVGRAWDLDGDRAFDDGAGATVTRTFATAGTRTVREQVTDNLGATSVAVRTIVVGASAVPTGNLTTNPSFETATTGWVGTTSALSRVAVAGTAAGTYAAKVTRSSGTTYGIDDSPNSVTTAAAAGSTYTAAAWLRSAATSSNGKTVTIQIRERNAAGTVVRTSTTTTTLNATTFTRVAVTGTVLTAGNSLDVFVQQSGAVAGDAFYADALTIVKN